MMGDHVASKNCGSVDANSSLEDLLTVFRNAREWSIDMDETIRRDGGMPMGTAIGIPVEQVDVLVTVLERAEMQLHLDAALRRTYHRARLFMWVTTGVNIAFAVWHLVMIGLRH